MNGACDWTLVVVTNPAESYHATLADRLQTHAPAACRMRLIEGDIGDPLKVAQRAGDVVLVLDPKGLPALVASRDAHAPEVRVATLLDWRFPRRDPRFEPVYRLADCVLFEDAALHEHLGRPAGSAVLPHCADDAAFAEAATDDDRGHATLWLVPDASGYPTRYEPWLPGPDRVVAGSEFEGSVLALPEGGTPGQRADVFRRAAVVVCAAETPEARRRTLEALACGCSVVVTAPANDAGLVQPGRTGLVTEVNGRAMLQALRHARAQRPVLVAAARADLATRSWDAASPAVFAALRGSGEQESRADLSAELTVYVSTVGAPGFAACLAHLARQDCRFRFEVIDRVAPMSAAFQRMLDHCTTPWYVQVDEDMMLYRDAVRRLHAAAVAAADDVALIVAYLHDTFVGDAVQGVKIFRHAAVRNYPLADVRSCEIDQLERMHRDGWRVEVLSAETDGQMVYPRLGLHDLPQDARIVFERFRTLELTRHRHRRRMQYLEHAPAMFLERFLRDGDPLDLHALLAMLAGRLQGAGDAGHEKDYRRYDDLPGFAEALAFMARSAGRGPDA